MENNIQNSNVSFDNDDDSDEDQVEIIEVVYNNIGVAKNQQHVNNIIDIDIDDDDQNEDDEIEIKKEDDDDDETTKQKDNNETTKQDDDNDDDENKKQDDIDENNNQQNNSGSEEYNQMLMLQSYDIVPNVEDITCPICLDIYGPAEAVVLKDCLHSFCWTCLQNTIKHSETPEVRCPFVGDYGACESNLRQREIKALVSPEDFEKHLNKSIKLAENRAGKSSFHCQTPNCTYWCFIDGNDGDFLCTICNKTNCLKCQGVHDGKTCEQYQNEIKEASANNNDAKMSDDEIKRMLDDGTAMNCTKCNAVLQKISGCDHITCAACRTNLNWRGRGSMYWSQQKRKRDLGNLVFPSLSTLNLPGPHLTMSSLTTMNRFVPQLPMTINSTNNRAVPYLAPQNINTPINNLLPPLINRPWMSIGTPERMNNIQIPSTSTATTRDPNAINNISRQLRYGISNILREVVPENIRRHQDQINFYRRRIERTEQRMAVQNLFNEIQRGEQIIPNQLQQGNIEEARRLANDTDQPLGIRVPETIRARRRRARSSSERTSSILKNLGDSF